MSFFSCIVRAPLFFAPAPAVGELALLGPVFKLDGLGESEVKSARLCVRRWSFEDALGVSNSAAASALLLPLSRLGVLLSDGAPLWDADAEVVEAVEAVEVVDEREEIEDTDRPRECVPILRGVRATPGLLPEPSPSVSSDSAAPDG